jgi:hypothetical protein
VSGKKSYINKHFKQLDSQNISPKKNNESKLSNLEEEIIDEQSMEIHRELTTQMTEDGKYHILEPTITVDQGPNCYAKVYNEVRLKYQMGLPNVLGEKELLPYAEAQCMMAIPISREVEDPKEDSIAKQSKYESVASS